MSDKRKTHNIPPLDKRDAPAKLEPVCGHRWRYVRQGLSKCETCGLVDYHDPWEGRR